MSKEYEINMNKNSIYKFIRIGYSILNSLYERFESKSLNLIISEWNEIFNACSESLLAYQNNFNYVSQQYLVESCQRFIIISEKLKFILMTIEQSIYTCDISDKITSMCQIINSENFLKNEDK